MPNARSWIRRTAAVAAAACVGVAGPLALTGVAHADDASGVPVTEIDVTKLGEGAPTAQPWASADTIHAAGETYPIGEDNVRSLTAIDEGTFVADISTHTAEDRILLLKGGKSTLLARGLALSDRVAVSEDGTKLVWSSWKKRDDNGNPVGDTTVNEYDVKAGEVTRRQTVADTIVEPANYLNGKPVFADEAGGHAYGWDPLLDEPPEPLDEVRTVSAEGGNHSAVVLDQETPKTEVVNGDGDVQWTTTDYRIVEFSEDSQFALAVDAESDGLGATEYTVLDARTGTPEGKVTTELTTQVTGEEDGSFVFDASNDGKQALVRFRPNTDADPELVSDPADWPSPPEDMPYVLSHR